MIVANRNIPVPDQTHARTGDQARKIGRGRSGTVYLDTRLSTNGAPGVRKVFGGDAASRIVLYALTGAPNPYVWCKDAIKSAEYRRRILSSLVRYWFKGHLLLPETIGSGWNETHRAYELKCGYVEGTHAPLRQPSWRPGEDEFLDDLVNNIMQPLQKHLLDSGCDGLVWQAGLGNPVAANNFMLKRSIPNRPRWVWIDLESGVPALFPMNPTALTRYYLPLSWKHRTWLFDDVDIRKLRGYVCKHQDAMRLEIGSDEMERFNQYVDLLERSQTDWKSLPRSHRSIAYAECKGRIDAEEANWYRIRPLHWTLRLWQLWALKGIRLPGKAITSAILWLRGRKWQRLLQSVTFFILSQKYRTFFARRYVTRRIQSWRKRGFLDTESFDRLRKGLRDNEASEYLSDFGVHLAIKPFVKSIQWWVVPGLFAIGVIESGLLTAAILVGGGPIARTLYTSARLFQSLLSGKRGPWLALFIGALPVIGNAAFPAQLVYQGTTHDSSIARFVLNDTFARVGQHIPIWGGRDTLTEHWFARLPDTLLGSLEGLRVSPDSHL